MPSSRAIRAALAAKNGEMKCRGMHDCHTVAWRCFVSVWQPSHKATMQRHTSKSKIGGLHPPIALRLQGWIEGCWQRLSGKGLAQKCCLKMLTWPTISLVEKMVLRGQADLLQSKTNMQNRTGLLVTWLNFFLDMELACVNFSWIRSCYVFRGPARICTHVDRVTDNFLLFIEPV